MSVLFSRQCEYALQAVTYLALKPDGEKTSIRELTRNIGTPYHFLAKILQNLTYKRLLVSQKGPTGGFALAKSANDISLFDIVEAIDGVSFTTNCVMGFPECSGKNPCAVHVVWGELRENLRTTLGDKTIAQMAKDMKKPEYRSVR
ncbi:MAG: Rrf2 family transcriptional regulator [Ignavibacteriales bacterium]|nr:Rrf2 family transcriptional regulator [Ignavibacteriales bacterium]